MELTKLQVKLIGEDGNAFSVLGICSREMKRAGWEPERRKAVLDEMMAGNYDHLLQVAMKYFDVR